MLMHCAGGFGACCCITFSINHQLHSSDTLTTAAIRVCQFDACVATISSSWCLMQATFYRLVLPPSLQHLPPQQYLAHPCTRAEEEVISTQLYSSLYCFDTELSEIFYCDHKKGR